MINYYGKYKKVTGFLKYAREYMRKGSYATGIYDMTVLLLPFSGCFDVFSQVKWVVLPHIGPLLQPYVVNLHHSHTMKAPKEFETHGNYFISVLVIFDGFLCKQLNSLKCQLSPRLFSPGAWVEGRGDD